MDTNDAARQRALRLLELGVPQRRIAQEIGKSPSWVNRWVNEKDGRQINATGLDGLRNYERALLVVLDQARDSAPTPRMVTPLQEYAVTLLAKVPQNETLQLAARAAIEQTVESLLRDAQRRSARRSAPVPIEAKRKGPRPRRAN